ncbi:cilia- and flagella-associated protein 45-like [Saccoglossus kowalevskii]|uniref:Cilia- and flagella-associated protein 45 n=1 Tax=Saccoglossus kowalevskii TaxID=10224 RepID=A0ABM0GWM5_SACKO|nr:PREDICTED: coiled-coil domain-containing protein 19, mitochondrial-like [Saccoglossus kowalevskii]
MPRSVVSSAGSSSGGSSASRRARTRQYYTVNRTSDVDESLFGSPHKDTLIRQRKEKEHTEDIFETKPASGKTSGRRAKPKKKEEVQVITKDLIRKLIVPSEDPSGQSCILGRSEYSRILNAARVLTDEEREAMFGNIKEEKDAMLDAVAERKRFIQEMDRSRKKNEKLSDLDEEAKRQAEYLLEKAREQREEQEDEIKHLNELILNAKCHAIRDAQILEKGQVKEEMTDEEKRLDLMMEVDRQNALKLQEEIESQRKEERLAGKHVILTQIAEREEERLLDQEKKDQEAHQMLKYLEKLQIEDLKALERKHEQQLESQKEIMRANIESEKTREVRKEQQKLEEQKVVEYMKQKAEREAAFEAEQERKRIEKEKEVARLRAMQERAKDYQAEKDMLRAKRNQEQLEREWRKKEREEAMKKAETEKMLKDAREIQVMNKEHFLAVQAARERAEFERVLQAQREEMDAEKAKEEHFRYRKLAHADDVRKQIREKEQLKIADRDSFFEEGIKLDEEARARRAKLDEIKKKKLDELRNAGVPEKYCAEVERRINAPTVTLVMK